MSYVPKRGDVVWLSFQPQAGREQAGRRPALILSPTSYNRRIGLALVCPITNQRKDYPFEVLIPDNEQVMGVILSDQIKSLDWRVRQAEYVCSLPDETVHEVLQKVNVLLTITSAPASSSRS